MSGKQGKYEYWHAGDDKWYFNRVAANGEVEHPSEGYSSKSNMIQAIGRAMADTSHYQIVERTGDPSPWPELDEKP
jgi:uncharacterized protein YegP (UPF0339 family)